MSASPPVSAACGPLTVIAAAPGGSGHTERPDPIGTAVAVKDYVRLFLAHFRTRLNPQSICHFHLD